MGGLRRCAALVRRARKQLADEPSAETPGCTGACARIEVPGGDSLHSILSDMHLRGDLGYTGAGIATAVRDPWDNEVWARP